MRATAVQSVKLGQKLEKAKAGDYAYAVPRTLKKSEMHGDERCCRMTLMI